VANWSYLKIIVVTEMAATSSKTFCSAREAGDLIDVVPRTIQRWAKDGRLTEFKLGPRTRRYLVDEVLALVEGSICEPAPFNENEPALQADSLSKLTDHGGPHEAYP
jgi:hypothetical protein